jgi:predicted TIM-barrel fold metal-dependent hydrolase
VVVQGASHGNDHRAMLEAISRSPQSRRGVAIGRTDISDVELLELDRAGVCAVRFNWITHLSNSEAQDIDKAAQLIQRVTPLGWQAELHIEAGHLPLVDGLARRTSPPLVIDHMARVDASEGLAQPGFARLLQVMQSRRLWVKLSGADRMTQNSPLLAAAVEFATALIGIAPDRCVWGTDWPHVNLHRGTPDYELVALIHSFAPDPQQRFNLLVANTERLYGFDSPLEQNSQLNNQTIAEVTF